MGRIHVLFAGAERVGVVVAECLLDGLHLGLDVDSVLVLEVLEERGLDCFAHHCLVNRAAGLRRVELYLCRPLWLHLLLEQVVALLGQFLNRLDFEPFLLYDGCDGILESGSRGGVLRLGGLEALLLLHERQNLFRLVVQSHINNLLYPLEQHPLELLNRCLLQVAKDCPLVN